MKISSEPKTEPQGLHWATCHVFAALELLDIGRVYAAHELLKDICARQAAVHPLSSGDLAAIAAIVETKRPGGG